MDLVAGVVLAAGAGVRMGWPKALLRDADGVSWAARAAAVLRNAGCDPVGVTLGAAAPAVRLTLDDRDVALEVPRWQDGPGQGVLAAVCFASSVHATALMLTLVDLPDVGVPDVRAVLEAGEDLPSALVRAGHEGRGGHPVLLGRTHWPTAQRAAATGSGLRELLDSSACRLVERPTALHDVDVPSQLPAGTQTPPSVRTS